MLLLDERQEVLMLVTNSIKVSAYLAEWPIMAQI